jgi:hypothetical protein
MKKRKGASPVLSTIVLATAVMVIGASLWSFTMGASTWAAENYVNDTMSLVNEANERFTIEHVMTSSDGKTLTVWVFNYGDLAISVDLYVEVNDGNFNQTLSTQISPKVSHPINVDFTSDPLETDDYFVIKIYSRRQNYVYENFIVE